MNALFRANPFAPGTDSPISQEAGIARVSDRHFGLSATRGAVALWILLLGLLTPCAASAMSPEAETLYQQARTALEAEDYAGALVDFKRAIPLFRGEDADVWLRKGRCE